MVSVDSLNACSTVKSLSNSENENLITVWGQDRIWLIEETINLMQVSNN